MTSAKIRLFRTARPTKAAIMNSPCYSTYLLQIVQTIYNYFHSLVWHSKSSRRGLLYTTCGILSLSFRNCKAKCSGRGWTTMASRDRLMKPVCHSKSNTMVYWIVTQYNIDYAVYKEQPQKSLSGVFLCLSAQKQKRELNNSYWKNMRKRPNFCEATAAGFFRHNVLEESLKIPYWWRVTVQIWVDSASEWLKRSSLAVPSIRSTTRN